MPATSSIWLKLLSQTFKAFHNLTPSRFPYCSLDLNSFNLHNFSSPLSSVECIPHPLLCAQECPGDQIQVLEHCVSVPPLSHSPSPTQCVILDDADSPLSPPTLHHNPSPFRASPRSSSETFPECPLSTWHCGHWPPPVPCSHGSIFLVL